MTTTNGRPAYEHPSTDDLELLLSAVPPRVRQPLDTIDGRDALLEIVLDLGREPEARFPGREVLLSDREVTPEDLDYVVARIGAFGDDNRAGIPVPCTASPPSATARRMVVGLTCRVGRSVRGTMEIIRDFVESGKSILILGKPGVGKTTLLREVARVLADDFKKRVIVVDTSNEIAGDGDIPHPGIGRARRMQVPTPAQQHAVMIEAVENHMPEVIVIDEIGTEPGGRSRPHHRRAGVQLVGTAHGNSLDNLMLNPTLSDLVGGIQTVTLGDEEARRRGTQKTVLERKGPPTFDVLVEMQERQRVIVHRDVAETVDAILRGLPAAVEQRWRRPEGQVERRLQVPDRFGSGDLRGRRQVGRARGFDQEPDGARFDRGGREGLSERGDWAGRVDFDDRGGRRRLHRSPWGERPRVAEGGGYGGGEAGGQLAWGPAEPAGPVGSTAVEDSPAVTPPLPGWSAGRPGSHAPGLGPAMTGATTAAAGDLEPLGRGDGPGTALAPAEGRFRHTGATLRPVKIYSYGVNRDRLEDAIATLRLPVTISKDMREADVVMTLKNYYRRSQGPVREAEEAGKPVFILKSNTTTQIQQSLETLYALETVDPPRDLEDLVMRETQDAINKVLQSAQAVELPPQNAYIRRLQHQLAERSDVGSRSTGREPHRRVKLYKLGQERDRWS